MAKNAVNYTGLIPETGDSFESATQNTTGSFDGIDAKIGVIDNNITDINNNISNVDNTSDLTKVKINTYADLNTINKTIIGAINETIVTDSNMNGNIKIAGVESEVYIHPNHSGDVISNGDGATTIQTNVVNNAKLSQAPTLTIKGNNTGSTANVKDLTIAEVQSMINGNTSAKLTTVSKTIVGAINELNTNTSSIGTGSIMGVRFVDNGTDFVATRYGITVGAVQESTTAGNVTTVKCKVGTTFLDNMMIYRLMRRGIFDNDANLVFDQDVAGYDDTLSTGGLAPHTHWVGVYIPKFWYRYNVSYDATVPLTVVQHVVDVAISDKPFTGAKVHEWFIDVDTNGNVVERSYRVASAFEGVAVNGSTGAYLFPNRTDITTRIASDFQFGTPSGLTAYSTYELTSVNKANAQAPATNATLSNFRTMCQNRHIGNASKRAITQQPWYANHAINVLFMIYYASMDWQGVLGAGVTNLVDGSFNESVSTGYTSSMKNNSGCVSGIVRGTFGTTQVTNFKGIENFFGNVWKFNEGLKKLSTGLGNQVKIGTYNVTKTNDYANYTNIDFTNEKEILNVSTTTNYFKFRGENMIANSVLSSSNYYRDYFYSSVDGQMALSGAKWDDGSISGGFAVGLRHVFGYTTRFIGSRVFS